ncbi:MAG: hypothetical protein HFH86_04815 [Bacilli bacterium]|nr:hypothetical protein [Bacilli bacterium]
MCFWVKIVIIVFALTGVIYIFWLKQKFKFDSSTAKEDIMNYFKAHRAISFDTGIKINNLPTEIAKNPYLLMMVKDETLMFQKGKYYLNQDRKKEVGCKDGIK